MKVFILEDSPQRIESFKQKLKKHDLYFFDDVKDACEAFNLLGPWDALFIDHDLGGDINVDSEDENTGYQFAKHIQNRQLPEMIIIHSINPVGSQNIKNILPSAQIIPFPNLIRMISG